MISATQSLALYDEHDRSYVAAELMAQCRTSVAYRYREQVIPVTDVPEIRSPHSPMRNLAELAQALQRVACYRYQSCLFTELLDVFVQVRVAID